MIYKILLQSVLKDKVGFNTMRKTTRQFEMSKLSFPSSASLIVNKFVTIETILVIQILVLLSAPSPCLLSFECEDDDDDAEDG